MALVRKSLCSSEESSLKQLIMDNQFYVCKICEIDCGTFALLKSHVQTEHKEEFNGYEICCKTSLKRGQTNFHEHLRLHLDKEAFKCQECGSCLTSSANLKKHMDSLHTVSTNFVCSTCGKGFLSLSLHNKHINRAHGHKYKCDYCEAGKYLARKQSNTSQHLFPYPVHLFRCRAMQRGIP